MYSKRFFMMTVSGRGYILSDESGNQRPSPSIRHINVEHTLHRETVKYSSSNGGGWEHIFSCTCGWKTEPGKFHQNNRPAIEHEAEVLVLGNTPDNLEYKLELEETQRTMRVLHSALYKADRAFIALKKKREKIEKLNQL